jgi:hypothetical protein
MDEMSGVPESPAPKRDALLELFRSGFGHLTQEEVDRILSKVVEDEPGGC